MAENGSKIPKIDKNIQKCPFLAQNFGAELAENAPQKRSEIAPNPPKMG